MKYVDEYRQSPLVRQWAESLHAITTKPWTIMEVCGGQTHAIVKFGLQALLPEKIRLIHGPGCPVCVTPIDIIDHALHIAASVSLFRGAKKTYARTSNEVDRRGFVYGPNFCRFNAKSRNLRRLPSQ